MTNLTQIEARRMMIAEACGWSGIEDLRENFMLPASLIGYPPKNAVIGKKITIPDYFSSLDAIHEAEKTLAAAHRFNFACILGEIVLATPDDPPNFDLSEYGPGAWAGMKEVSRVISATADQRAEAFGKTLNLW